ncbi:MAG TPA: SseB family protein [Gammaproteobacteria bacterium]|jgi:hypothetical protein|nr:SseB family protein [Gammaproteobacteria bacterium]
MTDESEPYNELERMIAESGDDRERKSKALETLVNSKVYVILNKQWDGQGQPPSGTSMMFVTDGSDTERAMLAIFTSRERAEAFEPRGDGYDFQTEVDAAWAFLGVPVDCGAYVNPNSIVNFRIGPEMATFIKDVVNREVVAHQGKAPSGQSIQ